jgi:hypothetical protein
MPVILKEKTMETITYAQVQELVGRLPVKKLPIVYRLLVKLGAGNTASSSLQEDFLLLPLAERRRLMAEQAKQMIAHYDETASERQAWQAGDFVEY